MIPSRLAPLFTALAAVLLFSAQPVLADEAQEIGRLQKQGQSEKALERANSYLTTHPKDAQVRFVKGVILTEQNKTTEAIKVFTSITDDYPELPEPYNNLAVLYASQGQYEKARTALEMAINTHPSYATAHENMGDIYAKMASQAYDKALQLDKGNANAQSKLALVKEIFTKQTKPTSVKPAAIVATAPIQAPVTAPTTVSAKPIAQTAPVLAAPAKPVVDEKPVPDTKKDESAAVLSTVEAWAKAWSAKNVPAYLNFYAPDLVLAKGESRKHWEQTRQERITRPKSISVTIAAPEISMIDPSHAKVTFKQQYHASSLDSEAWKTLMMVKIDGKWLIHEERIGR